VTAEDDGGAKIVVNITNDAWYGRSPGPYQHFRLAQLRSVESGIPLIRSANNGISGEVDGYGRVVAALALDVIGVIDVPIATALEPTIYNRHGQRVIFLLFMVLFAISSLTKLRGRYRIKKSV
jgi:apolipoprotein N-acyltransferase